MHYWWENDVLIQLLQHTHSNSGHQNVALAYVAAAAWLSWCINACSLAEVAEMFAMLFLNEYWHFGLTKSTVDTQNAASVSCFNTSSLRGYFDLSSGSTLATWNCIVFELAYGVAVYLYIFAMLDSLSVVWKLRDLVTSYHYAFHRPWCIIMQLSLFVEWLHACWHDDLWWRMRMLMLIRSSNWKKSVVFYVDLCVIVSCNTRRWCMGCTYDSSWSVL